MSLKTSKTRLCRRYSPTDLSKYKHIQNKTNRQEDKAVRVGLKLNAQKCEVTRMNTRREDKIMIGREEAEDVEESERTQFSSDEIRRRR